MTGRLSVAEREERDERIVRLHWSLGYGERKFERFAAIVEQQLGYNLAAGTLAKIVADWERAGRVQHRVIGASLTDEDPGRCADLERQLMVDYSLRHAIVAEVSGWPASPDGERGALGADNSMHRWLGRMASAVLAAVLRPGDRLGVGSGRGPHNTAQALNGRRHSVPRPSAIVSLTGSMAVTDWGENPRAFEMDADMIVCHLVAMLSCRAKREVALPLIATGRGGGKALPAHLDPKRDWPKHRPQVALVGIGSLAGGHRLATVDRSPDLDAMLDDIRRLREAAHRIDREYADVQPEYHCIGDFCNHLFVVPPPGPVAPRLLAELRTRVDAFNERAINAAPARMAEVAQDGCVIAVAGGRLKAHAIRYVLKQNPPWVTHLVTDDGTAGWLCTADEQAAQTPPGEAPTPAAPAPRTTRKTK